MDEPHIHETRHTKVVSKGLQEDPETGDLEHLVEDELVKVVQCAGCLERESALSAARESPAARVAAQWPSTR